MHRYGKLIQRQRMLIGLIKYCTNVKDEKDEFVYNLSGPNISGEYSVIMEEYEKLFKLLDEEKASIIKQGKNPVDFHPMPTYCVDSSEDPERYVAECEYKIRALITERLRV